MACFKALNVIRLKRLSQITRNLRVKFKVTATPPWSLNLGRNYLISVCILVFLH
jgi:hypothetical protein